MKFVFSVRLISVFVFTGLSSSAWANVVDDYIKKPDPSYSWKLEKTIASEDADVFVIRLHSQTWRTAQEVSAPLWQHWLTIVRPHQIDSDQALLIVGNGTSKEPQPDHANPSWVEIAKHSHSVVAEIRNVPNQPLVYLGDSPEERYEDNSVAYSWAKSMQTNDPTWSIRLPMIKAVVRAMDTVQAFINSPSGGNHELKGFVVSGASKRGWATWIAAAVDKRVTAIIPMVIDVLNTQKFLKHHHEAYGFWAPSLKDYVNQHIIDQYESSAFARLMQFEDPYSYRDRIAVPKLLIHSSGDQFFLPDSSQFYFHDLIGPSYLRVLPNTDHSMKDSDAIQCLESFYTSLIHHEALPRFSWSVRADGSIEVKVSEKPDSVKLWSGTNSKARDFRLMEIGKAFSSTPLVEQSPGVYLAQVKAPEHGFTAYFVELTFSAGRLMPLTLTTEVRVVPDVLPYLE